MQTSEGRVVRAIRTWFLTPDDAVNLAVVRITLCVLVFGRAADTIIANRSLPETRTIAPDLLGFVLVDLPRGPMTVQVMAVGLAVCAVLGALGYKTRWAMVGVLVFGTYHLSVPQIFGKVDHNHHFLWIALVVALAPCGDALSIDSRGDRPPRSSRYGFPLRVIWVLIGLAYFFAGLWKLLRVGPAWASAENMSGLMWNEWIARGGYEPIVDISGNATALIIGGIGTLIIEIGFIALLVKDRTRVLAVVGGLGFHLGIGLTIGIWFTSLAFFYVALVDWTPTLERLGLPAAGHAEADRARTTVIPTVVWGLLLAAVTFAGAGRIIDGWPVASYPDFGYEVRTLSAVELVVNGHPLDDPALTDLSAIERHRLLLAAESDEADRADLAATLEDGDACTRHPEGIFAVRREQFRSQVGRPEPLGIPEDVTVLICP